MEKVAEKILLGADAADSLKKIAMGDRSQYMNASEAMSCLRKQWYTKNDAPEDGPQDWGYARRGGHCERYIVERLALANVPMTMAGDDQESLVDEETRISATPDGFVWGPALGYEEGWVALEIKSIDPRTNLANLPREGHIRQVQICAAIAEKHDVLAAPIVGCKIIYMDASNYNKLYEYDIPLKPGILDQLASRARKVLDSTDAARLPREGTHSAGKRDCKMCPFTNICGVDGVQKETVAPKSSSMTSLRTKYISAKADEDEAKARKAKASEEIKAELHKAGQTSMQVDEGQVRLTKKAGAVSWRKVAEDHCPDVDLEPYRGSSSETLTVK